jgi:hypothetical protein
MSITTYAELKTAIASWLARDDQTANIPDWITLFECHAVRELKLRDAELSTTLTPASGSVAVPTDFLSVRSLTWTGTPKRDLVYMHPSVLLQDYATESSGDPINYTIEGGTIKIRPISSTNLTLLYRAKTAAVSGSLNWLFSTWPDAYLNGTLAEAHLFLKDYEGAALWEMRRDKIFDSLKRQDFNYRGVMQIRTDGATP